MPPAQSGDLRASCRGIDSDKRRSRMWREDRRRRRDWSGAVVCANFAWLNQVLRSVGVQVPVKSFVHQRFVTRPLRETLPNETPAVNANPLFGYFRPATGNRVLLGIETPDREEIRVESTRYQMDQLTSDLELRDR